MYTLCVLDLAINAIDNHDNPEFRRSHSGANLNQCNQVDKSDTLAKEARDWNNASIPSRTESKGSHLYRSLSIYICRPKLIL